MSIKVYLHFQPRGEEKKTSKISIPKSWTTSKQVADVVELFAKGFNAKKTEGTIDPTQYHLENNDNQSIFSNVICGTVLDDHGDYHIREGVFIQKETVFTSVAEGTIRCKNYGCNQYFRPDENTDGSCNHHTGPPVFHDTLKYWSCCSSRKAFDFETFQQITGCAVGRHSDVNVGSAISASPNAIEVSSSASDTGPHIKSIAAFNASNPDAASSEQTAARVATAVRKSTRSTDGVTARCCRKGCSKTFTLADNSKHACVFHAGSAIFHDACKFWSCCPDKKKFDFDEFLSVSGCKSGYHDDGEISEDLLAEISNV